MATAVFLTEEQLLELADIARADEALWAEFKKREAETASEDRGDTKLPSMSMIARDLLRRVYGPENRYDSGSVIMKLRYIARQELNLPV